LRSATNRGGGEDKKNGEGGKWKYTHIMGLCNKGGAIIMRSGPSCRRKKKKTEGGVVKQTHN